MEVETLKEKRRGNVWIAVSGLVVSENDEWLVVKKKYGGLKGKWSLPAGFINEGETADEAVVREVLEETGILTTVKGLIGLRTGVINGEISDNMIVFLLEPINHEQQIIIQESELMDVKYIKRDLLVQDKEASIMLQYLIHPSESNIKPMVDGINPGNQFGYTAYKLFF
ncbi:NUDIX domain-containing protein [Cytobacillus sp. FJAT-54145]|uniref:NUDIX domain-containing protein n=1 Tax=Cytobacillus spartinae TaxID=3299023 RepID=A0ABW6KDV6_9BACI